MLIAKAIAAAAAAGGGLLIVRQYFVGWDGAYLRKILGSAVPLMPQQLVALVLTSGDRLVLERFRSETEVGLYSLAYTMGMAMNAVTQAWVLNGAPTSSPPAPEDASRPDGAVASTPITSTANSVSAWV